MLTGLSLLMLITFMVVVMSGRVSVLLALILIPIAFGLIAGFGFALAPMMLEGIELLAPTGVMLCFAILYFCLMSDAGLFDPLIRGIVRLAGGDPVRVVTATAALALLVSLDGDGSTTYLICCTAMAPIYRRLGLNPLILATVLALACGITNITPWGGPTAAVASALRLGTAEIFVPLIPGMLAAATCLMLIAYFMGVRERRRLGGWRAQDASAAPALLAALEPDSSAEQQALRRPRRFEVNLAVTALLLIGLVLGVLPLPVLFMLATSAAFLINYPSVQIQKERLAAHAPSILPVIAVIFAAGIFVGVLNGTGMAAALGKSIVALIPTPLGPLLAPITGLLSVPLGFVMSNKAYFYGVVPVVAEAAGHYGVPAIEIARAALTAQAVHLLSPTVPSTFLLAALAQVEFGALQRFALKWAVLVSLTLLAATLATGAIASP